MSLSVLTGLDRAYKAQSATYVLVAIFLAVGSILTTTVVVLWHRERLPYDWHEKGTISCASQDGDAAHGKLFTIGVSLTGVLLLLSMYPFWLYQSWAPWHTWKDNAYNNSTLQP